MAGKDGTWRDGPAGLAGAMSQQLMPRSAETKNSVASFLPTNYQPHDEAAAFGATYPFASQAWDLQAAKEGELPEATEVLEYLTYTRNINQLAVICPYRQTNALQYIKNKFTFLPAIARKQAERTRPSTFSTKTTTIKGYLENYIIGFEIPFSALTTQKGQQIYAGGLVQMRNSMTEAIGLGIVNALETVFSPWRTVEKRFADTRGRILKQVLANDLFFFGLFQKFDNPWDMLATKSDAIQRAYLPGEVTKRKWILVTNAKLNQYVTQVIRRQTQNDLGGQEAVDRVKDGPDAVTEDNRGNRILTLETIMVDNEPRLDLLKNWIDYSEFNEFRRVHKRSTHGGPTHDDESNCTIYNIDRDEWFKVTKEYIIDGSGRYDRVSGAPRGINDPSVSGRHAIEYPGGVHDSYHYQVNFQGKVTNVPCLLQGHFSPQHVTHQQVADHGHQTALLMKELHKYMDGVGHNALIDGMAVLKEIENQQFNGSYLAAAAQQNVAQFPTGRAPPSNRFAGLAGTLQFGQNTSSGWALPGKATLDSVTNGGAAAFPGARGSGPVGYGSAAGFLALADAADAFDSADKFRDEYGFSRDIAVRAGKFIRCLQQFALEAQARFPENIALDPASAAPWYDDTE
jgi:hypothetical protein